VVSSDGILSVSDRHTVTERRGGRVMVGVAGPRRLVMLMVTVRRCGWRLGPHRLHRQYSSPLLGQLGSRLRVRVEQRKVGHDDGYRQRYRQYAGKRAQRADEHADISLRRHIAVSDCSHGYNGPPQTHRDGREVVGRVVLDALSVVDKRREDDYADDEKKDE